MAVLLSVVTLVGACARVGAGNSLSDGASATPDADGSAASGGGGAIGGSGGDGGMIGMFGTSNCHTCSGDERAVTDCAGTCAASFRRPRRSHLGSAFTMKAAEQGDGGDRTGERGREAFRWEPESAARSPEGLVQFTKATPRYTVPYVGPTTTWNDSLATARVIVVALSRSVITTTLFGSAPWSPEALDVDVVA